MALQLFPSISKTTSVSDGTKYAYIHVPPAPAVAASNKPTFLLLHGFPSSTFDWRHVVPLLREQGYGIVAPDLLGYGDSDKPTDVAAYSLQRIAGHVMEIVKGEGLGSVIGVGHDWGATLLSATALLYSSSFTGIAFLSVGYTPPGPFDIKFVNALFEQHVGYPAYGYMEFFNEDDAASILDAHAESLTSLVYSTVPEDWKVHMGGYGTARKWVSEGRVTPAPAWMSKEEVEMHVKIFEKGGYTGPLNWYKSFMRGIDEPHYSKLTTDESKNLDIPSLLVLAEYDYACIPQFQLISAEKHLPNRRVEKLECSHWIPAEKPVELVALLDEFARGL